MFKLSHEREEKMREARCTFPDCSCPVPSHALSAYNRTEFCVKLKDYEEKGVSHGCASKRRS